MNRIKLYGNPYSNNSMRAQLCLDEKGIAYEYVSVDLFKGEHKADGFKAITPRCQVPCLVDGDIVVYESVAICEYLERRYPEPPLISRDPAKMATCVRLIGEFHQKLDPKNIFGSVRFRGLRRAELGDRVSALLAECQQWEHYLGEGPYFTGEDFALADVVVLPFFATVIDGLGLPAEDFPRLHAWYQRVKERPAARKQPWFEAFAGERNNADLKVLAPA